jgi:hypothetical protein
LNEVIREECGVKEKNALWCVERMDERRLTKEIYEADTGGNAGRVNLGEHFLTKLGKF